MGGGNQDNAALLFLVLSTMVQCGAFIRKLLVIYYQELMSPAFHEFYQGHEGIFASISMKNVAISLS